MLLSTTFIRSSAGELLHLSSTVDEVLFELLFLRVAQMLRMKLEVYNKVIHELVDLPHWTVQSWPEYVAWVNIENALSIYC